MHVLLRSQLFSLSRLVNLLQTPGCGNLNHMFPILFSIGNTSVSSFGVFLALSFLFGIFMVWRLSRAWDLDEEKTLDLTLLTFVGGLIGARAYFVILNLPLFSSPLSVIMINRVPGLSFWGGILGGWLTMYFFAKRFRMDFWFLSDIAAVGVLGGLVLSDLGCFFGGCNIGIASKDFFAVTMIGAVGKRLPVQIIESLLLAFSLGKIWSEATHFHQRGKIVGLMLVYLGLINLLLDPLKAVHAGRIFSTGSILIGAVIYYKVTKQSPVKQLKVLRKFLVSFITNHETRKEVLQNLGKNWYNQKTAIAWKIRNLKKMLRRINVKLS